MQAVQAHVSMKCQVFRYIVTVAWAYMAWFFEFGVTVVRLWRVWSVRIILQQDPSANDGVFVIFDKDVARTNLYAALPDSGCFEIKN